MDQQDMLMQLVTLKCLSDIDSQFFADDAMHGSYRTFHCSRESTQHEKLQSTLLPWYYSTYKTNEAMKQ